MKKQITIDGENSDWYEKAIFILKDREQPPIPDNLFLYAEYIVENHLKKNPIVRSSRKIEKKSVKQKEGRCTSDKIDRFFNISLVVCSVSVLGLIIFLYI